ncbi:MAG TPA: hypothetical protein VFU86_12730 [Terriglobales bacterium]|nr:hypothetical protein [Terriglobales bacterium]
MAESERDQICFEKREFRGSRFRCLLATHESKPKVIAFLNSLVHAVADVNDNDSFMPEGFSKPEEARLGETPGFLSEEQRRTVTNWWLAKSERRNTPNWDTVSTCTVEGHRGLLLVEAKAHAGELNANDSCGARDQDNREKIRGAITDANQSLGQGWRLSVDSHYQISNRFAWAWKLASLGVPTVLVYLGFLNAHEMRQPFASHSHWERCLLAYADGIVPRPVWNSTQISVARTPVIPLIRSADVNVAIT